MMHEQPVLYGTDGGAKEVYNDKENKSQGSSDVKGPNYVQVKTHFQLAAAAMNANFPSDAAS